MVARGHHAARNSEFLRQLVSSVHGHLAAHGAAHISLEVNPLRVCIFFPNPHNLAARYVPESPRWLILHERIDEAEQVLIKSAHANDRTHLLPDDLTALLQQQSQNVRSDPPPANWWALWKGNNAVRHMICVHLAWAAIYIAYYGLLLNIRAYSREHLKVNTVVAGACEIIGVFVGLYLILYTKKKWLYVGVFNVFGGFVAYFAWFIPPNSKFSSTSS